LQNDIQNKLYKVLDNYIPPDVFKRKNRYKTWEYGYNEKYNVVVISKTGEIGEVYDIDGLIVALPAIPDDIHKRSDKREEQYWERKELPKSLSKFSTIFQWNKMPDHFKNQHIDYIENEFKLRDEGYWLLNNGIPTYMTGGHYMYLQWSKIDVGYPDYREANRILFIHWEACRADSRSFGQCYLKIRRSGFSFMGSSECVNISTIAKRARIGILSKTGPDAKKMFVDKVVPINSKLPFFFRPIMSGMDKPKTELSYQVPAGKITKNNMHDEVDEFLDEGLDTTIDWKNTDDNAYDGEKLLFLVHDESGKYLKPNNILNSWRVQKTCLRLGKKITGKCMMGSTVNALAKGGGNFKKLYEDSRVSTRSRNGRTKSGLYSLFIPMEQNMEGFIDRYGMPVLHTPEKPILGIDGEMIAQGAIDFWEAERDSLKGDADALNEFFRQFPRTESHAFRDESKSSLFNLTKLYQQIDYNDSVITEQYVTRGSFHWENGIKDTKVIWTPNPEGRFYVSWLPRKGMQNKMSVIRGLKHPGNEHVGAFGCDSYDISGVVGGGGSNGSLHGITTFNMEDAPSNEFFLEYIARPQTAEIFFEEVLLACVFYGMPILVENNKPRLLYHFKNRGYRHYCLNRPDKAYNKLSKTERELGGIPNSSEDVKQAHAAAIESYIEKYVGYDMEEIFRDADEIGTMPFNRTLIDWAKFDISNRTKHDASISSGLARMAVQRHLYQPQQKESKISVKFVKYDNRGMYSEIIK